MAKGAFIRITGIPELRAKIRGMNDKLVRAVDAECEAAALDFVNGAINDAPVDEGILKNQITYNRRGLMNYEPVSAAPYSAFVEFGTKSRVQVPADLAAYAAQFKGSGGGSGEGFFEHILGWVKRKGFRFESAATYKSGKKKGQNKQLTLEQTAWFVYLHLIMVGVKAQPFFFKQRAPVMNALRQRIKPAVQKALK